MSHLQIKPIMDVGSICTMFNVHVLSHNSPEIIAEMVQSRQIESVAVEGFPGVGKSTFAAALARLLRWRHIALDDYHICKESARFTDHVDRARLRAEIGSRANIVVEGACLREAIESIDIDPFRIYLARVSLQGGRYHWHDAIELEAGRRPWPNLSAWLAEAIDGYHRRVQPHRDADFTFLRIDDHAPAPPLE
jgi:hypothetical protein